MTKILITGAGGFVGTYLIKELLQVPDNEIYAAVYKSTSDIQGLINPDHIIEGDMTDFAFTQSLIAETKPNLVYHLAAVSVVQNTPTQALKSLTDNVAISCNMLESLRIHAHDARFMAVCSANVYGAVQNANNPLNELTPLRPLNAYAVSKVTQEMLALQYHLAYNLDTVILRPFNHTGVGQTTDFVIPRLAEQFAKIEQGATPPVIEVGNTETIRDFTDVRDMVKAYVMAAHSGVAGETYNLGSGVSYTIAQVIEIFQSLSLVKVEIKTNKNLVRTSDVPKLVADITKFSSLTHWAPTIPLKTTLSDILNYYRGSKL